MAVLTGREPPEARAVHGLAELAGSLAAAEVLARIGSTRGGLSTAEAAARLADVGPNAVRTHHARPLRVLGRQLRSAVLLLLLVTAAVSYFLGNSADAVIIGVILMTSIGLGFVNEYRAERTAAGLHDLLRHTAAVVRDGRPARVDVTQLVPGDVVLLSRGQLVPADLRLLESASLACDEAVLTGESTASRKSVDPVADGTPLADVSSCAWMGTIVATGTATGVVVSTGARTQFGRIAVGLGEREPETEFQTGLRRFSLLLLEVAVVLTALILVTNLLLHRALIDSLLFSLAIAVGVTPQLLPAVVSTSLAVGARSLARHRVLVKRLVCIEDLGDIDVLVTDKTGTLTGGRISFEAGLDATGAPDQSVVLLGLLATEVDPRSGAPETTADPLDAALWAGAVAGVPGALTDLGVEAARFERVAFLPFDHERRLVSALVRAPRGGLRVVTKGAPEAVLARCRDIPAGAESMMQAGFAAGSRIVAVAVRDVGSPTSSGFDLGDERDLSLTGFLVFRDEPKPTAAECLKRLARLGVRVVIATGDSPGVARKVCGDVGLGAGSPLTGAELERLDGEELIQAVASATVFARVTPDQKATIVRMFRAQGSAVGFLGDGVNDALALHAADVGISVDTATDVARDAADIILLEKDLGVLADGVVEGRRIFANTIKYVLMGTSSNFGNMFSAAAASGVLPFLPMLPSQILLTNLLYDSGQLAIPSDNVDEEQLRAPSHWDIAFIRRFMLFFGPLSSFFDFLTFGVLIGVFHAGPSLFRTGWFIESLATQSLVILAIRTRRSPSWHSRPGGVLLLSVLVTVAVGVALPLSPLAGVLGFQKPPMGYLVVVLGMVTAYLVLIEGAKRVFFAEAERPGVARPRDSQHGIHRRAGKFSHAGPLGRRATPRT